MSGLTILPRLCLHLDLPGLGLGGGLRRRRGREGLLGIRRFQDLNVELPHLKKEGRRIRAVLLCRRAAPQFIEVLSANFEMGCSSGTLPSSFLPHAGSEFLSLSTVGPHVIPLQPSSCVSCKILDGKIPLGCRARG